MWRDTSHLVPVIHANTLFVSVSDEMPLDLFVNGQRHGMLATQGRVGLHVFDDGRMNSAQIDVRARDSGRSLYGSPVAFRFGGWDGSVSRVAGRFVHGFAHDRLVPGRDVAVVAFSEIGVLAFATARVADAGAFLLILPPEIHDLATGMTIRLGIVGSDYCLPGGVIPIVNRNKDRVGMFTRVAATPMRIAIKISTPDLRVAHEWGDYHFANSLRASFEKIGAAASVDTHDVWYEPSRDADVVLTLRGRHRVTVDKSKLNLLWLISHPDRVEPNEYDDYDHVFVASDLYAQTLIGQGVASVSVLHQATDHRFFKPFDDVKRRHDCLFVGNSRREYRRMVHWCIEKDIPMTLYGGGWGGVVAPELVKAENIPNADLARHYAQHLILLNDHWDTMRDQGFPSNRLFDGSAVGTPIITDAVVGLSEIFGDTINVVRTAEQLRDCVADCLKNPEPYLNRAAMARDTVLKHHTFDQRADVILRLVEGHAKYRTRQAHARDVFA